MIVDVDVEKVRQRCVGEVSDLRVVIHDTQARKALRSAIWSEVGEGPLRVDTDGIRNNPAQLDLRVDVKVRGSWLIGVAQTTAAAIATAVHPPAWSGAGAAVDRPEAVDLVVGALDFLDLTCGTVLAEEWWREYRTTVAAVQAQKATLQDLEAYALVAGRYLHTCPFDETSLLANGLYLLRFFSEVALGAHNDEQQHRGGLLPQRVSAVEKDTLVRVLQRYYGGGHFKVRVVASLIAAGFAAYGLDRMQTAKDLFDEGAERCPGLLNQLGLFPGMTGSPFFDPQERRGQFSHQNPVMLIPRSQDGMDRECAVVYAADFHLLRQYLPRIVFQMKNSTELHYHFHVVERTPGEAEEFHALLDAAGQMIGQLLERRVDAGQWSISRETAPEWVENWRAYCACSRYLHGDWFLEALDSDVWIQDTSSFLNSAPEGVLDDYRGQDVTLTCGVRVQSIIPWQSFLTLGTYVRPSPTGRDFFQRMREYCSAGLARPDVRHLDRTALDTVYRAMVRERKAGRIRAIEAEALPLRHHSESLQRRIEGEPLTTQD